MTRAYINYPEPHFGLHVSSSCNEFRKMGKPGQRVVQINPGAISTEFERFATKHYRFAAESGLNDMWLELDFDDSEFEVAVVRHIRYLLGIHYRPLREAEIRAHDCAS